MTTNRPEFKPHDDFNFEHKKIGKVTREEFIKYIRGSHDHMRKLSQIIQQYDQTIDEYLEEWDGRFESFDDDVKDLLGRWIQDGTMDHIINDTIFNWKADKTYVDDEIERLDLKDEAITNELEKIAINPINFGGKFDGSDDTQPILEALEYASSLENSEVLLTGLVGITSEIEIPTGVTINSVNATIKPLKNTTVFSFNRNTHIKGTMTIDVRHLGSDFTSDCLYFNGSKSLNYRDISIGDILMLGDNVRGMGKGIHLLAKEENSSISFVNFKRIVIRGFEYGVKLDAPALTNTSKYNYVNGNIFNDLTISDCDYYIYGTGNRESTRNHVDGNRFNAQLQYSGRAKEIIHLESRNNVIDGIFWDMLGKDVLTTVLTETSQNNYINGNTDLNTLINKNEGRYNRIRGFNERPSDFTFNERSRFLPEWKTDFQGEYSNLLYAADKIHSVNILEGEGNITTENGISPLFITDNYQAVYLDLSNDKRFSVEINFNGYKYANGLSRHLRSGLNTLGVSFNGSRVPKHMIVEVISPNDDVSTTNIDLIKEDIKTHVLLKANSINGLQEDIQKIRLTFIGQKDQDVRISNIFADSYYTGGNRYLSTTGGVVTGRVEYLDDPILTAPNGDKYRLRVSDSGELIATVVTLQ